METLQTPTPPPVKLYLLGSGRNELQIDIMDLRSKRPLLQFYTYNYIAYLNANDMQLLVKAVEAYMTHSTPLQFYTMDNYTTLLIKSMKRKRFVEIHMTANGHRSCKFRTTSEVFAGLASQIKTFLTSLNP